MKREEKDVDEETETDDFEEDESETEESNVSNKSPQFFGIPIYKLSYKRVPKKCLKCLYLTVNTLFLVTGVCTIFMAIWLLNDGEFTSRLTAQKFFVDIALVVGIIYSVVALLGFFSFVKRSRKLVNIFIACHTLLLIVIFITSILSASFFEKLNDHIHREMKHTIAEYKSLEWVTRAWDNTQKYLHCCGIDSSKDWVDYYFMEIPLSCCSQSIHLCHPMTEEIVYEAGCLRSTYLMLKSHIDDVAVIVLLIAITSGLSVFVALGLKKRFKTIWI